MALPSTLSNFTSPILDKALKTGARGVTQTTTNYGVIGDAFFKKAQLDLGVANLQADIGIKKAQIMGGLEMDRARLELQKGEIMANAQMRAAEIKSQMVSDTEKILGTIGGAASGAVAGFAVGGPYGAAAGAALGGAASYAGYSQSRQAGQQAVQTVGLVSNAAVAIKGWNDQKKKEDGFKSVMDNVNKFKGLMDSATNVQDFNAAHDGYTQAVSGMASGMAKAGWNPQEIADFQAKYAAGAKGIYSGDAGEFDEAYMGKLTNLMRNDKLLNNDSLDPSYKQERIGEILGEASSTMNRINKYDPTKVMTAGAAQSFGDGAGQSQAVRDFLNPSTPVAGVSIAATQPKIQAAAPSAAPATTARAASPAATQTQAPIPQAPQVQTSGAPMENHIPFAPQVQVPMAAPDVTQAPGVTMFTQPVNAEVELTKMGAETVDALKLNPKKGMSDDQANRATLKEKFNEWTTPGLAKQREAEEAKATESKKVEAKNFFQSPEGQQAKATADAYKAQITENLNAASKSKFMSTGAVEKAEAIDNSVKGLQHIEDVLPKIPNDDQLKAAAVKVYLEGLRTKKVGQALGTVVGTKGGIAGTIAGNVLGDTADTLLDGIQVGKGSKNMVKNILSPQELAAVTEYHTLTKGLVPQLVRTGENNAVTEAEAVERMDGLINYGQDSAMQYTTLNTLYRELSDKADSIATASGRAQTRFNYEQSTPIKMRGQEDRAKAFDVSVERQLGSEYAKQQMKPRSYIERIR